MNEPKLCALENSKGVPVVSACELIDSLKAGRRVELIDVRTPIEYRELHVEFARNVPLARLDPVRVMESRTGSAEDPLYLVCQSGKRAELACETFRKAGFLNVFNVDGGTRACLEAGLPAVRELNSVSLERQVRIAAGLFVLLGLALGYFVHPGFTGLSAFVGAGLVFSGVTNTCGMAMLLARMPWNQGSVEASSDSKACCAAAPFKECSVKHPVR